MTAYLLESALCLLVMLLVYRLILSNTSLHQLKRYYLLACLLIPLSLPLLQFDWYYGQLVIVPDPITIDSEASTDLIWSDFPATQNIQSYPTADTTVAKMSINWGLLGLIGYGLITAILLFRLLRNIVGIWKTTRGAVLERHGAFKIYLLDSDTTPYSFFGLIFIARQDYEASVARRALLCHELAHAKGLHSLDILLLELTRVIFWFNPLYLMLSKSMKLNHEYIADAQALAQVGDSRSYQILLLNFSLRPRAHTSLVSPSDFSFIKNRFTMMTQSTSRRARLLRLSLLMPLMAIILFSFTINPELKPVMQGEEQQDTAKPTKSEVMLTALGPRGFPMDSAISNVGLLGFGLISPSNWTESSIVEHHEGIDIASKPGRSVIATAAGVVEVAAMGDNKYGNYVLIKHGDQFKTLYASLSELSVKTGERVATGQKLGIIGASMKETPLPGKAQKLHYGVMKDGEWENPKDYLSMPSTMTYYTYLRMQHSRHTEAVKEYDLDPDHIMVNFSPKFPYQRIVYDRNKAIFFVEGKETVVKAISDLSPKQWETLRKFSLPPPPPKLKTRPTADIVAQWEDAKVYGIWIDGKRVANEVMSQYSSEDFADYFKSRILKNAKNYGKHKFQLDLTTNTKYALDKETQIKKRGLWEARTELIFKRLGQVD